MKYYFYNSVSSVNGETEKAYKITVGNNHSWTNNKDLYTWIPKSQTLVNDNKLYISAWLVSQKTLWDVIDKGSYIEKDKSGNIVKNTTQENTIIEESNEPETLVFSQDEFIKFVAENSQRFLQNKSIRYVGKDTVIVKF